MSKLDELIAELCPNGVEYRTFGESATIVRGASPRPIKNFITTESTGVNWIKIGDVKPGDKYITASTEKITPEGAKKSRAVKKGDFVLSNSMSFGRPYILQIDGCIHDGWLAISNFSDSYLPDFLYHLLNSNICQSEMQKKASFGGAVQNLNADIVRALVLPVPPLEVQREIVRVLDSFSLLTAKFIADLTAELTARKSQYDFYRDKLLTFSNDIPILPLGEVCQLQAGKAIKATFISGVQTKRMPVPCYGANGLRGYVADYNQEGNKSIIGRQGALCGNVCYATGKYYATEHAIVVTDRGHFNGRYLFHALTHADLNQYRTAGAQPGLSVSHLNEVKIASVYKGIHIKTTKNGLPTY